MRAARLLSAIALAIAAVLTGDNAKAEDPFYKGKRLTVLINFAPGGPTDIEGRLLAKHLPKHIDGQPNIIVQNMDGGGGMTGILFLGDVAPKDGTVVGYLTGAASSYATDPSRYRIDFRKYEFVGIQPGANVYYVRTDVAPGLKQPADLLHAQGIVSGGLGADNSKDLFIRMTLEILGVTHRHVTGYRSNQHVRLALQQNEVNLFSESPPAYRSVIEPSMVKTGQVIGLYYDPINDGGELKASTQMEGMPLLPFHEFYRAVKGKPPSGRLWEAYRDQLAINGTMLRMIVLPPQAPQASVEALRTAVTRLNSDPAFAEEAQKTFGFVPVYDASPGIEDRIRKALTISPETRAFVADYIRQGKK